MIKSILTQIWNQRRSNAWLFAELFIIFIMLWYSVDVLFTTYVAASRSKGYDISHLYDVSIGHKNDDVKMTDDNADSLTNARRNEVDQLVRLIGQYNGVEGVLVYGGTDPYNGDGGMFQAYTLDSVRATSSYIRYITPEYMKILRVPMLEGHLNDKTWNETTSPQPAIITKDFADSLFHSDRNLMGRVFMDYYQGIHYKVVGVCARQKFDDYGAYQPFIFTPISNERYAYMGSYRLTIRVRPDADVNFQERFMKEMSPVLNSGEYYLFNIQSYKEKKQYADFSNGVTQEIRASQLILSFFIFNVFLGLIGSFWFRIRQRRGEIALRMALGCSRIQVRNQLFTEGLMLLVIAMIPALLVNLNIYFAGLSFSTRMEECALRFVIGQLLTFGLMALMVLLGILFPTRQAMKLQPAEALHEE